MFVYIIESPSPRDLADGRTEGASLRETFRVSSTGHEYRMATNVEEFLRALDITAPDSPLWSRLNNSEAPLLHLSMHGDKEGIQLTDGTVIEWDTLRTILTPLNDLLPLGLFIAFSTCGGAASIRMSMREGDDDKPFFATIGSFEAVPWADALVAFTAFYHNWFKHRPPADCVARMRAASGHDGFEIYSGADQKAEYREYVGRRRLAELLTAQPSRPTSEYMSIAQALGVSPPSQPIS